MTDFDRTRPSVSLRIGAELLDTGSAGIHEHLDPTTGEVDAKVPLAGEAEVAQAVAAAQEVFPAWRALKPFKRRRVLEKLADLIEANAAEFTRRGTLDNGTPVSIVGGMVPGSVAWTRYYAGWADRLVGEVTSSYANGGELGYTVPEPYGVVAAIITWNAPLLSLAMKVPAALAAGNTLVVKPSEITPFTADLFAQLATEAGVPAGVLNMLSGDAAAGAALVAHRGVKKVSFTGGPQTARRILAACAETFKPVVLELGGKSANIIFDDADLKTACMAGTFMSIGSMSGQGCALPTRMVVQEGVYDEVVERVARTAGKIAVGDPFDPATVAGPVVNQAALDRVLAMIGRAKEQGARLVAGGERLGDRGFFVQPTVFADVDPQSELGQQEVFGPVLSISKFATEEEAVAIANATDYGLSGYVQTADLKRAHRVAEQMVTGEVLVNGAANLAPQRPFGGVGASGVGKEGGRAGIEEFLRFKSIAVG